MTDSIVYIGSVAGEKASFADAILNGAPAGGGLYIPGSVPHVEIPTGGDMIEVANQLLRPWVGNALTDDEQYSIAKQAFTFDVPLIRLATGSLYSSHVLELTHGPTGSFKDFGARWLARSLSALLRRSGQQRRVIVATSGDTGSAVADAFSGLDGLDVVLLYPKYGVSEIQRRQLVVVRPGVTVFEVEGVFDDCQAMVKKALQTSDVKIPLTSANSINMGRLLPQMTYYVVTALQINEPPVFIVPSGNLGNLTAGLLANASVKMDARFIAAHNVNDSMVRYLRGQQVNQPTISTISNAMDVGSPSNLERITALLEPDEITEMIKAFSFTDSETLETMRQVYETTGYVCDPHTAIGLGALSRFPHSDNVVVLSTAHPAKFPGIVKTATGFGIEVPDSLRNSLSGKTKVNMCGRHGTEFFTFINDSRLVTNNS